MRYALVPALVPLLTTVLLVGCSTPQQRAAELSGEAEQMVQLYGPACERLGYVPATDPWRNCLLQFSVRETQRYNYSYPYTYGGGWYRW